eukprot:Skav200519  [mRNA]  locus=scaffold450:532496:536796:- [translate_table: standard]
MFWCSAWAAAPLAYADTRVDACVSPTVAVASIACYCQGVAQSTAFLSTPSVAAWFKSHNAAERCGTGWGEMRECTESQMNDSQSSQHQGYMQKKLEVHLSDLSTELMALKECLVEVGILHQEHFLARLHHKRFAATSQAHPLGTVQDASQALGTSELTLAVINAAGPSAARRLLAASRGISQARAGVSAKVFKTVECFDPKLNRWERLPPMQDSSRVDRPTTL